MTLPPTFLLLCDKNTLFMAERIVGLQYFHKPTERMKDRKKERYHSFLIPLKYFAANATIIDFKTEISK